jgi:hypothetical protein
MNSYQGKVLDAQLHLLDRQILDTEDVPVTTVDDVELSGIPEGTIPPGTAPPVITNLLSGSVLGTRMFGGRPPAGRLERIPWRDIGQIGTVIRLNIKGADLDIRWVEHWVRDHVIGRIPGGRHDPQ